MFQSFCLLFPLKVLSSAKIFSQWSGKGIFLSPLLKNISLWIYFVYVHVGYLKPIYPVISLLILEITNCYPSVCFYKVLNIFVLKADLVLSEPVQVISKYFRRIILLHRDHCPLSEGYDKVRNTSFAIKQIKTGPQFH